MRARIYVTLKPGVLDPAGQAVEKGLHSLGFAEASQVRLGKFVELELGEVKDPAATRARLAQMCEKLLANTVVENYRVELP